MFLISSLQQPCLWGTQLHSKGEEPEAQGHTPKGQAGVQPEPAGPLSLRHPNTHTAATTCADLSTCPAPKGGRGCGAPSEHSSYPTLGYCAHLEDIFRIAWGSLHFIEFSSFQKVTLFHIIFFPCKSYFGVILFPFGWHLLFWESWIGSLWVRFPSPQSRAPGQAAGSHPTPCRSG